MRTHAVLLMSIVAASTAAGIVRNTAAHRGAVMTVLAQEPAPFDLDEVTIATLLRDQQSGRRSARQIAEQYLAQIRALDRSGPTLNSVIELNPDALAIADALDAELKSKGPRGPLHGI